MNNEKLVWTDEISVNNEKFNIQHRKLFEIINELGEERAAMDPEEYARLLSCLTDYFRTHFVAEEQYMEKIGYPDLKLHRAEHSRLIYDIAIFNLTYTHQVPTRARELQKYMKDRFLDHILNLDLDYRDFKAMKENTVEKVGTTNALNESLIK